MRRPGHDPMKTNNLKDANGQLKKGVFQEHFKDGTLACASKVRDGKKVGLWKYYLRSGQLRAGQIHRRQKYRRVAPV
jgi:antitoxin component YwqK of YwqJK toxin-antitoxin module